MIELITGTPGAGKTTFAVATRLVEEAKRRIVLDPETCLKLGYEVGHVVTRRLVVAGIRGLTVEHERLPHVLTKDSTPEAEVRAWNVMRDDAPDEPVHQRLPDQPARTDVPCIMQNWWLWCRPGDLIVIDEAQFVMPRATLGKKPPYWLQALEIHRHYGVDFLLITQHPQLIDTTVRALVGLHRHVRSVMGSPVCMVYTWDHASNPERYHLANKSTFIRRAAHYRLFHSTVAVVKPPASGRWGVVAAPVLLAVGLGGLGLKLHAMTSGGSADSAGSAVSAAPAAGVASEPARASARPAGFFDAPKLSGCYAWGERCECVDKEGRRVRVTRGMCELSSRSFDGLVAWEPRKLPELDSLPKSPPPAHASPGGLFGGLTGASAGAQSDAAQ